MREIGLETAVATAATIMSVVAILKKVSTIHNTPFIVYIIDLWNCFVLQTLHQVFLN